MNDITTFMIFAIFAIGLVECIVWIVDLILDVFRVYEDRIYRKAIQKRIKQVAEKYTELPY